MENICDGRRNTKRADMTDADKHHLNAAQGWLELGLFNEAFDELETIDPQHRASAEVLKVRWSVYQSAKKSAEAAGVATGLTRTAPDVFDGWWMLSFSLHEMKRTQEAFDNLVSVRKKFAGEFLTHYNLACYLTQLGRLDEARESLKLAFELNPKQRTLALEDPDLNPLRAEIQSL